VDEIAKGMFWDISIAAINEMVRQS
jgi:hypothetical protein